MVVTCPSPHGNLSFLHRLPAYKGGRKPVPPLALQAGNLTVTRTSYQGHGQSCPLALLEPASLSRQTSKLLRALPDGPTRRTHTHPGKQDGWTLTLLEYTVSVLAGRWSTCWEGRAVQAPPSTQIPAHPPQIHGNKDDTSKWHKKRNQIT